MRKPTLAFHGVEHYGVCMNFSNPSHGKRMRRTTRRLAGGAFFLTGCLAAVLTGRAADPIAVSSPSGSLKGTVLVDATGHLGYTVTVKGQPVVLPSPLGITVNAQNLGEEAELGRVVTRDFHETYPVAGVHAQALNEYHEASIQLTSGPAHVPWVLEVRAYDDGFACRYRVPGTGDRTVNGESTGWRFPAGGTLWYQNGGDPAYEAVFVTSPLDTLPQNQTVACGCAIRLPGGIGYVLPTEADVHDYSDLLLLPTGSAAFRAAFPRNSKGWGHRGEIVSPWRVALYSPDLNGLVNSDLLRNLCPPPTPGLQEAAWIKPGRSTWHWLLTLWPTLEPQRRWIDRTGELGWEYYLIDDGWNRWQADGKNPWEIMQDLGTYADQRHVKLWAWVNSRQIREADGRMAYFKQARAIGLVGLKIDFPEEPNADTLRWYDDTLRDAAAEHLMVDFHGAVKPAGRERTWPNELTREAVRGREVGQQPGVHDTTLPFTRYVQGHADFTPVDWRPNELKGGSWAHGLAEAFVYTSPFLCVGGDPEAMLKNEAVGLLKALPATWDETVVLPGSAIGEVAAFARRKGDEWFVAVLNGPTARQLDLPLAFLASGEWKVDQFADDPSKNDAWLYKTFTTDATGTLACDLRADGGFVARLTR